MQNINVSTAKTAELLAFYNANSGKNEIKKFASRTAAEKQVTDLLAKEFAAQGALNIDAQNEADLTFVSAQIEAQTEVVKSVIGTENAAFIFPKATDFIAAVTAKEVEFKTEVGALFNAIAIANDIKNFEPETDIELKQEEDELTAEEKGALESGNTESEINEEYERQALEAEIEASANPSVARANPKHDAEPVERGARRSNALGVSLSWGNPEVRAARLIRDGVTVTVDGVTSAYPSVRQAFRAYRLPDSVHIRFRLKLKSSRKEVFNYKEVDYLFEII